MNIFIVFSAYLILLIWTFRSRRSKMTKGEKRLYWVLGILALLSAVPASVGLGFDNVGASLSGMVSLFSH